MKKFSLLLGAALLLVASGAAAATTFITYNTHNGDTLQSVAAANGTTTAALVALNPSIALQRGQTLNVGYKTVTPPPPATDVCPNIAGNQATVPAGMQIVNGQCVPIIVVPPPPSTGEIIHKNVYNTGYGWPDNTPAGGDISNGVIHTSAGGTGTYADPITVAVGHSIIGGKDILDFAAGTKFYSYNLKRYFIVEDTCGDGNSPQNGACHSLQQAPAGATLWLDVWVGGQGLSKAGTLACEDAITALHTFVENPVSTYPVQTGPIYNGACSTQFGDPQ